MTQGDAKFARLTLPGRRSTVWILLLLTAATVAAHGWILRNSFVGLDDEITVYGNKDLLPLTSDSFFSFWTTAKSGLYAPLTYSVLAGISLVARRHTVKSATPFYAFPFHAASLVLHVATVWIVYFLLRRLIRRRWPAVAGALLFSLHPVQVETVAWVTEINGLLCGFFALGALLAYLRFVTGRFEETPGGGVMIPEPLRQRRGWYLLATLAFVFALFAKALAVMVPFLGAILFWFTRRKSAANELPMRIPWGLGWWLDLAIPIAIVARTAQPVPEWWIVVPLWLRPLVAADALAFYVCKVFYPATLLADYNRSPHEVYVIGWAYFTWILPAALAVCVIVLWRRRRADWFVAGALWFVVALLPVLGLTTFAFQHWSTVADRYLHLPMFGIALMAAGLLARLCPPSGTEVSRSRRFGRAGVVIVTIALLATLGVLTALQTQVWRDGAVFNKHTRDVIGRNPSSESRE